MPRLSVALRPRSAPRLSLLCLSLLAPWLAGGCGEPPLHPAQPSEGAPHFTVMSYNIELGAIDGPRTLAEIGDIAPDIACLQEVTPDSEIILRDRYAALYPYQLFQSKGGAGGLAVLSRFPLTDGGLDLAPEDWHPAWHVQVASPAGPLQLLNIHLRSLFSADPGPIQSYLNTDEDHLTEMRVFSGECASGMSSIVLGDFNEGVDGPAIQFLEDAGFLNLLPAFRPGQPTWHYRSVGGQFGETLDHILIDGSLRPLNAWVEPHGQSDHFPVIAHLEPRTW